MKDIYIIDRFEGDFAVCEHNGEMEDIERSKLPDNCKEGDLLICKNGVFSVDKDETKRLRDEIRDLQDELFS